jgi:hypothetical protein
MQPPFGRHREPPSIGVCSDLMPGTRSFSLSGASKPPSASRD